MRKIAESSLNALGQLMLHLPLQRLPTPWALGVCALALRGRAGLSQGSRLPGAGDGLAL